MGGIVVVPCFGKLKLTLKKYRVIFCAFYNDEILIQVKEEEYELEQP